METILRRIQERNQQHEHETANPNRNNVYDGFISEVVIPLIKVIQLCNSENAILFIKEVGTIGVAMFGIVLYIKTWEIVSDGIHILIEMIPSPIKTAGMVGTILVFPGRLGVHQLSALIIVLLIMGLTMFPIVMFIKTLGKVGEGIHILIGVIPAPIRTAGTILILMFIFFIVVKTERENVRSFSTELHEFSGLIFTALVMLIIAKIMWKVGFISVQIPISLKTVELVTIILIIVFIWLKMKRLYVEQYRLIQTLCGGTGVTDVTDIMDVMDIMDITDIMDVTDIVDIVDIMDVAGVTDVADVMNITDITDITDVAGVTDVTDITGGTVRHMAYEGSR